MIEDSKVKGAKRKNRLRSVSTPNLEGAELIDSGAVTAESADPAPDLQTESQDIGQREFALDGREEDLRSTKSTADKKSSGEGKNNAHRASEIANQAESEMSGNESNPNKSSTQSSAGKNGDKDLFDEEFDVLWGMLKANIQNPRKLKLLAGQEVDIWLRAAQNRSIDEVKELTLGRLDGARRLVNRLTKDLRNRWPGSN
jgi:hypothetical protein